MSYQLSELAHVAIILDETRLVCGVGVGKDEDTAYDLAIDDFLVNRVRPEHLGILLSGEINYHKRQLVHRLCDRFGWRIVYREIETVERSVE